MKGEEVDASIRLYNMVMGAICYADLNIDLDGIFKDVDIVDVKDKQTVMRYMRQMNGCMPAYIQKRKELYTEYFESKSIPLDVRELVMSNASNAELFRWYGSMQEILVAAGMAAEEVEESKKSFLRHHPNMSGLVCYENDTKK